MNNWKSIVGLIVTSMLTTSVWAQGNTCEQQLAAATAEFEAGRFYGIPAMLKPCIDKGFSREQRQRAFLLLTQTYLLLEDPIAADNSYLEVLRANPEFLADTARDQIEVVYLSKRFTATPIFSVFVKAGGNTAPVNVIHTINPTGGPIRNDYKLRPGFQVGGGVDWNINEKIAVTAEANYIFTSYRKNQFKFPNAVADEEEFTDQQNWLTLPLSVKYTFSQGKIRPYGYAGYAFHWLFSDKGQIEIFKRDQSDTQTPITREESSPSINFSDYRRKINQSVFFGGGVRYKIGTNFWFADLRYNIGLRNVVVETSTFDTEGPAVTYGHVDDYFKMDNLSLTVGFVKPFYKPRKIKHAKTKTVLKGLKKNQ